MEDEDHCNIQRSRLVVSRMGQALQLAEDFVFLVDKSMLLQYVNKFAAEFFECPPEEIVGKPIVQFFPLNKNFIHNLQQVFALRKTSRFEEKIFFRGQTMWLDTLLSPVIDEHDVPVAVLGILRDITARRRK